MSTKPLPKIDNPDLEPGSERSANEDHIEELRSRASSKHLGEFSSRKREGTKAPVEGDAMAASAKIARAPALDVPKLDVPALNPPELDDFDSSDEEGGLRGLFGEWAERIHERLGARPMHLVVFLLAVGGVAYLKGQSFGTILAPAVGYSVAVEHPAVAATWVEEVFVRLGDRVEEGAPLLTLSSELLDREIAVLDAGIERLHHEAQMNLARLSLDYVDKQLSLQEQLDESSRSKAQALALSERMRRLSEATRDLKERMGSRLEERTARLEDWERTELMHETYEASAIEASELAKNEAELSRKLQQRMAERPQLMEMSEATLSYYEASIQELQKQREVLLLAQKRSTVFARSSGRVEMVLQKGAGTAPGLPVATIVPDTAAEIVAYLPSRTHPQELTLGSKVNINARGCPSEGTVLRAGGHIQIAPEHLRTRLLTPVWGLPVYISVPEECQIGVGQSLKVEIQKVAL